MSASARGPVLLEPGLESVDGPGFLHEEVRRLQLELAQKERQLERKNRLAALGEMAAGVAHEIRNPLGGIGLCADILRKELAGDSSNLRLVERISSGIRTLNMLVEGMLAFAAPGRVEKKECMVREIVDKALSLVEHELRARGTIVLNECGFVHAHMDPGSMIRAFANIILNAAQAMNTGGTVTVRACEDESDGKRSVCVRFSDTGPGVSPEIADRVFDPFFTGREGGTGLGLSVVHSTVEKHGGAVDVESGDDGGAVFRVIIPRDI